MAPYGETPQEESTATRTNFMRIELGNFDGRAARAVYHAQAVRFVENAARRVRATQAMIKFVHDRPVSADNNPLYTRQSCTPTGWPSSLWPCCPLATAKDRQVVLNN